MSWSSKYWIRCYRLSFAFSFFLSGLFQFLKFLHSYIKYSLCCNHNIHFARVFQVLNKAHCCILIWVSPNLCVLALLCICNSYTADIFCFFVFIACNFHWQILNLAAILMMIFAIPLFASHSVCIIIHYVMYISVPILHLGGY